MARCWVCDSTSMKLVKHTNIRGKIDSESFAITDSKYGVTGALYQCGQCGFLQSSLGAEVLAHYEDLADPSYEENRHERALQARKLLQLVRRYKEKGRLLDVGAATGILVEEATRLGYEAEGIEISKWLQQKAQERGLRVQRGVLPSPLLEGPYDVVTLIDVIEHIANPLETLKHIRSILGRDGIIAVVTPDIGAFAARLFGWKWWHCRVAHIGYFNRRTLEYIFNKAGFRPIGMSRPSWYFSADYLIERVNRYLPKMLHVGKPKFTRNITVPLNLRDSLFGIFRPRENE